MLYIKKPKKFQALFVAVGCVCIFEKKILLLKRNSYKSYPNHWGLPSGKIEDGEDSIHALIREVFEETNILLSNENVKFVNNFYVLNPEMQFEYLLFYTIFPTVPAVVINQSEHIDFEWVDFEDISRIELIPYGRETIEYAIQKIFFKPVQLDLFTKKPLIVTEQKLNLDELNLYNKGFEKNHFDKYKIQKIWYVAFGAPGVGKTTTFQLMNSLDTNLPLVKVNLLQKLPRLNFYLIQAIQYNQHKYFFPFQMDVLSFRYWISQEAPSNSLVDESIYSTLAYSLALLKLNWIKRDEFEIFYNNFQHYVGFLPKPDKLFYFDSSTEFLIKNIKKRNRPIEKYFSFEYMDALNIAFRETANYLKKCGFNVVRINAETNNPEDIAKKYVPNKSI